MNGQKTGGRVKGTPNRVTKELRETLKGIVASELESLPTTLNQLTQKERLEMVIKLLPFCLPKVSSIDGSYDAKAFEFDWT